VVGVVSAALSRQFSVTPVAPVLLSHPLSFDILFGVDTLCANLTSTPISIHFANLVAVIPFPPSLGCSSYTEVAVVTAFDAPESDVRRYRKGT
jgi:hypothetical protein